MTLFLVSCSSLAASRSFSPFFPQLQFHHERVNKYSLSDQLPLQAPIPSNPIGFWQSTRFVDPSFRAFTPSSSWLHSDLRPYLPDSPTHHPSPPTPQIVQRWGRHRAVAARRTRTFYFQITILLENPTVTKPYTNTTLPTTSPKPFTLPSNFDYR